MGLGIDRKTALIANWGMNIEKMPIVSVFIAYWLHLSATKSHFAYMHAN
jgi:hypothetical protein